MPQLKIPYLTFSLDTAALVESVKQFDPLVDCGHQILGETPHIFVCGFLTAVGFGALTLWSYLLLHLSTLLSFEHSWARAFVTAVVLVSVAVECFKGLAWYARWVLEANGGAEYSYAKATGLDKVVPIEMTTYTISTTTTTTTTTPATVAAATQMLESMVAEKQAAAALPKPSPTTTTPAPPALPSSTQSTSTTKTTTATSTVARGRTALRSGFGMSMADWSNSDEERACAWRQWARGLKLAQQLKGMRQGVLGEGEEQRWVSAMRW
ncbi:hypothetical protein HDK90DRAFT_463694 [Phyllosticta capitalensis]|uniref:Uncharacterized protein n=1 Tax=Phyllosticta capitalensis TaxID=121624 RepID=A0ABR1YV75_9PEZI